MHAISHNTPVVLLASSSEGFRSLGEIELCFTYKEGKKRIKIIAGSFGYDSLMVVGPNDHAFWEN